MKVVVASAIAVCGLCNSQLLGELRKSKVGDLMPEFSLSDANGQKFVFEYGQGQVTVVAFVAAEQEQSKLAVGALKEVALRLSEHSRDFRILAVCEDVNDRARLAEELQESVSGINTLVDGDYKLWGKLGLIVRPTVVISGNDDKIVWIKSGYGYEFAPALRLALEEALGMVDPNAAGHPEKVRTLNNKTTESRTDRHVQMARLLERKGRLDSAAEQLRIAHEMEPNSVEIVLELGEIYCKAGRGEEALEAIASLTPGSDAEKVRARVVAGWAKRLTGDYESAEKLLSEAISLDPKSARAHFEMGMVYEATGRLPDAVKAYRAAVELLFAAQARD